MKYTLIRLSVVVLVMVGLLAGCQQQAPAGSSGASADAALRITGKVDNEVGWTENELGELDMTEAEFTNKDGETTTYTGVAINTLLDAAGVQSDAAAVVFVADDDYTSPEVSLNELRSCSDCILAPREEGGFNVVLPGFPGNVQVKGVVEIQAQ